MANRPAAGFSDELLQLQGEVEADVGEILRIAEQARGASVAPTKSAIPPNPSASRRSRPQTTVTDNSPDPSPVSTPATPPLLNVTTRLTQQTNEFLTEAALRQRLKKTTPATRQDIIEAAVCDWLQKHGYGR